MKMQVLRLRSPWATSAQDDSVTGPMTSSSLGWSAVWCRSADEAQIGMGSSSGVVDAAAVRGCGAWRGACLGEAGGDAHGGAGLWQSLYRGDGVGGFDGAAFSQAGVWVLGWREDVQGTGRCDGAGRMALDERI